MITEFGQLDVTAANQGEREIDHDDHGVARTAEGQHEQHEQSGDYRDEENGEAARGALLALELTAVFQTVPGICCSTQGPGPPSDDERRGAIPILRIAESDSSARAKPSR